MFHLLKINMRAQRPSFHSTVRIIRFCDVLENSSEKNVIDWTRIDVNILVLLTILNVLNHRYGFIIVNAV